MYRVSFLAIDDCKLVVKDYDFEKHVDAMTYANGVVMIGTAGATIHMRHLEKDSAGEDEWVTFSWFNAESRQWEIPKIVSRREIQ